MRHAVIIINPDGPSPAVQFFARMADAKPRFKALELADGERAELVDCSRGRCKRKRGHGAVEPAEPAAETPAKTQTETETPRKRGRRKTED